MVGPTIQESALSGQSDDKWLKMHMSADDDADLSDLWDLDQAILEIFHLDS
jgi:hypothetical protein